MNRTALLLVAAAVAVMVTGCPKQDKEVTDVPAVPENVSTPGAGSPAEGGAGTGEVAIYVPCGLTVPMVTAIDKYEEANPGVKIKGTYDNAITHALKIRDKGEGPDLFVSPGRREVGILEEAGLVDPADKWQIGYFELVVSVPKDNPRDVHSLEDLTKADVITMPDPDRNSIGLYGKQALEAAGLWEKLMPKGDERILLTEFPIDAYTPLVTGKSEAAIMFENCPMKTDPEKLEEGSVKVVAKIDKSLYEKPICYVALLKDAPNPEAARAFAEYLATPDGQAVLAENSVKTLDDAAGRVGDAEAEEASAKAPAEGDTIMVEAFYPDNEGHAYIKEIVDEVNKRYAGKVKATFYAFGEDATTEKMREYDLMCGTICINGEKTVKIGADGQEREVSFTMGEGAEWTRDDLYAYLDQLTSS